MRLCWSSTSIIEDRDLSAHLNILTIRGSLSEHGGAATVTRNCARRLKYLASPGFQDSSFLASWFFVWGMSLCFQPEPAACSELIDSVRAHLW